jgi:vacuolar-type H+-ATPase subunit H
MHSSEHPEFMRTVKEIREAEEEYDRLINSAKEKAEKQVREAREKSLDERTKSEEETVAYKNERLRKGGKAIEGEVEEIISKAKDDAAKASKKKADPSFVSKLVKDFLNAL